MSTTTTYAVTMAELRAEPPHGSLWSNYGSPVQMSGRFNPQDAPVSVPPPPPSHLGRPRSPDYPSQYHHDRQHQQNGDGYDRYPHPSLMNNIPSINSLKRGYSQVDQPPYQEIVQDLREDYKPSAGVSHDQKLLSFKKVGDKHTIVDGKGRIFEMEIDAQLHGMFFLSEFASGAPDNGSGLNAELTCYRRNLFQISGSLCFPQTPLSVLLETGEATLIKNMEVGISAIESVDGHPVRLIVIPWKTPPPNAPDVNQAPDQEPPALPLIPWSEEESAEAPGDHYAIYPIGWRRLQFRIATANNGRRKELQQHFVLHLKLHATLANGDKIILSELTTAPIVVRGRSPRNFQARKEIPLLGSSAGSRGQTLVETGHGIVAQAMILNKPPYDSRPRVPSLDVPRSAFTFTAPKQMPASPMGMRSNSYPTTWNPSTQVGMSQQPGSASAYPSTSMAESYQKVPLSGASGFTAEPQEMPLQQNPMPPVQLALAPPDGQSAPIRTQYANYVQGTTAPPQLSLSTTADSSLNVPRYVDHNPRPSKSPRHASHQSVHSNGSLSNDTTSNEYRYGPSSYVGVNSNSSELSPHSTHPPSYAAPSQDSGSAPSSAAASAPPARDYFPSSQSWPATAGEQGPSSVSYTNGDNRPYAFPDHYKTGHSGVKNEPHPPAHAGAGVYPGPPALSHYQWGAT